MNQAQLKSVFHQTKVGIVFPKHQAVFGPGGEHAVGFVGAPGDQIIDHHPHVGLGPVQNKGRPFLNLAGGVDAGPQALGRGLFIPGGAVDLTGKNRPETILVSRVGLSWIGLT